MTMSDKQLWFAGLMAAMYVVATMFEKLSSVAGPWTMGFYIVLIILWCLIGLNYMGRLLR